jgi:hypothetical protein
MYELTTIKGLIKCGGLAAFAIAMLLSLSAVSPPAQAQQLASFFAFEGFQGGVTVGMASGQTVRISIATTDSQGRLLIGTEGGIWRAGVPIGHVKVFESRTGALLQSRELTGLITGVHTIDINRDDLPEEGEPRTGRIQLWIEVVIAQQPAGQDGAEVPGGSILQPTFEVIDNETGRTILHSTLIRVRPGRMMILKGQKIGEN